MRARLLAGTLIASFAACAWTDAAAQTRAEEQMEKLKSQLDPEAGKLNQEVMDKLKKEHDERWRDWDKIRLKPPALGAKPQPIKNMPGDRPASRRREATAAPPPPPSRVVYGPTRKAGSQAEEKPAESAAPARAASAPEKPPCVFKPVMSDAEIAACR